MRIKIKEFERKQLIQHKEISGKKCYRILEKEKIRNEKEAKKIEAKSNLVLKKKEDEPYLVLEKREVKHNEVLENSVQRDESVGEKTQEMVINEFYYCSVCDKKFKSNSEQKKHQKVKDHLFMNELLAILLKHYGNADIHRDSISFVQNLKSKSQKREKSILHRVLKEKIKETDNKEANFDLHKLLVKYNPENSKFLEMLGDIYVESEDYKNAIVIYKEAMIFTSKKSFIQSKLSPLYFKMGDQENLIASIKKIIPSGPKMSQARLDSKINRDWKRLKSDLMSQNKKTPRIPKEILDEKLKKFEQCEMQYLFWYLDCPPTQNDVAILNKFMRIVKAKYIHEINSVIHYRTFDKKDDTSIHIKAMRKDWGFAINIHRDLFKHQHAIFDKKCLELLSKLYIFLKKKKGGHRFILPRQEKNFQSYLGNRFYKIYKYKH